MADTLTPEKRSWIMSRVKSKSTSIEVKVCKYLYSQGFRYRKNVANLAGKPDIVLGKYHTVIFIHGCFWHRHTGCKDATTPKTNTEFWLRKFTTNIENDKKHLEALQKQGWNIIVLWECEINGNFDQIMQNVISTLRAQ
jgi:DNA mismatch endonuclease (patch repair protein)